MTIDALKEELNQITLAVGDVIIDASTNAIGFLLKRERRIDILQDDLYFWEIKWTSGERGGQFRTNEALKLSLWEEEQLKLSIILGIIKWQSIDGGSFEL